MVTEPLGPNGPKQRQSLFSSTQIINTRKSKEKEGSNKRIPTTHVDLMK